MAVPPNHPILIPLFLETPILFYRGFYASYLLQRNENGPKKPPNPSPHFVSQLTQAASSSEAPWIQTAGHEANEIIPQTSYITILRCVLKPTRFLDPINSDIHKKNQVILRRRSTGFHMDSLVSPAPTNSEWKECRRTKNSSGWILWRWKIPQNQRKSDEFGLNYLGKFSGQV